MMVSPRLPGLLQTLEKHPGVVNATKRPRIEECLPQDVSEQMLGCLDRESLCTARLVSKTFRAAAWAHVCSLTLASTSQAVSFPRYPHLCHVTVTHVCASSREGPNVESLAQLDPCLRDLATALTIKAGSDSTLDTRDFLSQAALMPKLRKLEVEDSMEHVPALLARYTNLQAISISWLGHATNLRNLQALSIHTSSGALPLIGNLTGLTGLTVSSCKAYPTRCTFPVWPEYSIAPLTRLTRLRALAIRDDLTQSNLRIGCCLGSGSLLNLELWVCEAASRDCGKFLSHQTALKRLSLYNEQLCNLRHMQPVRVELLQRLEIDALYVLDAEGLSVLHRATSLTKLSIVARMAEPQIGLSHVLARLTQLRSLGWHEYNAPQILDFPLAMSPLTGLTKLMITSVHLHDGDLRALLGLTGLRKLELEQCRLTDAVVPELAVLPNLNTLKLLCCGVTSLACVSDVLDPLRKARGLPPMYTTTTAY